MGTDHTCPLHLAGDRLCYKGCGCRCEDCTEMHRWHLLGAPQADPALYLQDLSEGACVGTRGFTELPQEDQWKACTGCPVRDRCAWRAAGSPAYDGPARRAQTWAGTDRQCRGRLLAVLRDSHGPVHRSALDDAWHLPDQRERCLDSLLADGLVVRLGPSTYSLP